MPSWRRPDDVSQRAKAISSPFQAPNSIERRSFRCRMPKSGKAGNCGKYVFRIIIFNDAGREYHRRGRRDYDQWDIRTMARCDVTRRS